MHKTWCKIFNKFHKFEQHRLQCVFMHLCSMCAIARVGWSLIFFHMSEGVLNIGHLEHFGWFTYKQAQHSVWQPSNMTEFLGCIIRGLAPVYPIERVTLLVGPPLLIVNEGVVKNEVAPKLGIKPGILGKAQYVIYYKLSLHPKRKKPT